MWQRLVRVQADEQYYLKCQLLPCLDQAQAAFSQACCLWSVLWTMLRNSVFTMVFSNLLEYFLSDAGKKCKMSILTFQALFVIFLAQKIT